MLLWVRAAIVSSILLFVPFMMEQFDHPKAVAVRCLAAGALTMAALSAWRRRPHEPAPRWTPLDGALLVWLAVEVAVTIASQAPRLSLWGDYEQHEGLLTSIGMFGIYVAARLGTRSPVDAEHTLRWLVGAAAISGTYGLLLQTSGLDHVTWTRTALYSQGFVRPFGTLGHPNLLGVTTAASLAIAASMAVLARRGRAWWAVAAALIGVITGFTLSRGAWLGGATGLIVARWATLRADAEPARSRRLLAMIVLASLVAAVLIATVPIFRSRFLELLTPTSGPSRARLEIWKTALAMWRAHPWWGVGPDAFLLHFERYQTPAFWRLEWATVHFHAHSIYLHTLATRGLVGLAAALLAAFALGHALWSVWRRGLATRTAVAPILAALAAVAVAGAFGALGNAGATEVAALLGTVAALAAAPASVAASASGATSTAGERPPARSRGPRSTRREGGSRGTPARWGTPGWIGAAMALLALVPQLGGLRGSRAAAYGRDLIAHLSPVSDVTAVGMVDRSVQLDPGSDYFWKIRANTYLTLVAEAEEPPPGAPPVPAAMIGSWLDEAERSARRAIALMPLRATDHAVLGNTLLARARHGEPDRIAEALVAYRRSWELAPYNALTLDQFAFEISALGRPDLGIGPARRAAALYPDEGLTQSILGAASMRLGDTTTAIGGFRRALASAWRNVPVERALVEQTLRQMEAARSRAPDLTRR